MRSSFPPHFRFSLVKHVLVEFPEAVVFSAAVDADAIRAAELELRRPKQRKGLATLRQSIRKPRAELEEAG